MSISGEIARLSAAKEDIAAAITDKGVGVPEGTGLDGMAELIREISGGGGTAPAYDGSITVVGIPLPAVPEYDGTITIA